MCLFCDIAQHKIASRVVYEDEYTISFLDAFPQVLGHCLVIPKQHFDDISIIDEKTLGHVYATVQKVMKLLELRLSAEGFNILTNCKEVAGQTVIHFHVHIIPRYDNDGVLFMNERTEIPQSKIDDICKILQSN
jgi:histidine triad (HIT) family protein